MDDNGKFEEEIIVLQLYVTGMSPRSMEAIENVRHLCDNNKDTILNLEIIDLYKNPEAAGQQQIIFSPTLIKVAPLPRKTIIGTFSDFDKVKKILGLKNSEGQ